MSTDRREFMKGLGAAVAALMVPGAAKALDKNVVEGEITTYFSDVSIMGRVGMPQMHFSFCTTNIADVKVGEILQVIQTWDDNHEFRYRFEVKEIEKMGDGPTDLTQGENNPWWRVSCIEVEGCEAKA